LDFLMQLGAQRKLYMAHTALPPYLTECFLQQRRNRFHFLLVSKNL